MSSKRGHHEGSWPKRTDGRAEFKVTWEGQRRSFYGKTKKEALAKFEEFKERQRLGLVQLGADQTLEQFLREWLDSVAGINVRPASLESYEQIVRDQIVPELGKVRLTKLTAQQVQGLYGRLQRRGLSPTTVVKTHAVLHRALRTAMEWDLIARNPADVARPPRKAVKEMRTLSASELLELLEAAPSTRWAAFLCVAATTGMRRGEVMGLRWQDVDLEGRSLKVQRSAQRITGRGMTLTEPKTARARRSIALTGLAVDALRRHRSEQSEHRLKLGPLWTDQDLVFPNEFGGLLEETTVTRVFKRTLASAGLPPIRLHDLRHTAATMMMEQAVNPKVVQEMLGHSTIAITLDIYSHVTPHMQSQAAAALDRLLDRSLTKASELEQGSPGNL